MNPVEEFQNVLNTCMAENNDRYDDLETFGAAGEPLQVLHVSKPQILPS